MKYRWVAAAVLVVAGLLHGTRALAEVPLDDALAAAERCAGHSLAGARAVRLGTPEAPRVSYIAELSPGAFAMWTVDLRDGAVVGWRLPAPAEVDRGVTISVDQAIVLAGGEATRMLGVDADGMHWSVQSGGDGAELVRLLGTGPLVGDPPRAGLTANCRATVYLQGARLVQFDVDRPFDSVPAPVAVGRAEAVAAALQALLQDTRADAPLYEEPLLSQWRGRARWTVKFRTGPGDHGGYRAYCVDALSGTVISSDRTAGVARGGEMENGRGPAGRTGSLQWLPVTAVASALLLVLTGAALVVRRRRRAA